MKRRFKTKQQYNSENMYFHSESYLRGFQNIQKSMFFFSNSSASTYYPVTAEMSTISLDSDFLVGVCSDVWPHDKCISAVNWAEDTPVLLRLVRDSAPERIG